MTEAARWTQYAFLLFTALLGGLYLALPALTRPGVFFAVTVEPAFRKTGAGQRIVRGYRIVVAAATLMALGVTLWIDPTLHEQGLVWPMVGVLVAGTGAFLWARSRVLPHAAATPTVREAAVVPRTLSLPGGALAQSGPFLLLLATAGWLALSWERIPARFPVHWNASGVADAVMSRSPAAVFGPLVSSGLACLFLLVVAAVVVRWSRRIAASDGAAAAEGRFRRLVLLVVLGAEYLVAATASLTASLPLLGPQAERWTVPVVLGTTLVFVVVAVAAAVRMGQGGSRLPDGAAATDGTEDRYWKLGLLYVNPDDPAIFVEKRFGIGYTVNFGNRWAWLILAAIVVPIAAVIALGLAQR
ncbi:MAG TPA: DUF1648 domain-containing protein [Acidobacteria bacterium]|nr:DUF1648 domain-containing protein [Acidobacteriota bacterium]